MAEKNYQVNEEVTILYQAPGKQSGAIVVGEIYLPSGVKDSTFPDITLTERASTGTYVGTFTPNDLGEWQVIVHKDDNSGQVTKRFSVGNYNVAGVGAKVEIVESKVDIVDGNVDDIKAQVLIIEGKINAIETPPMIS